MLHLFQGISQLFHDVFSVYFLGQYILEKPASESTATVSTDPRTTASWIFSEFMDDGRR